MSESLGLTPSPSSHFGRGDNKLTARGASRQSRSPRESPPPSTPHQTQDKNTANGNSKKKDKTGKEINPDVFSIDLMTPMTELQIAYFGGDPLNTTYPGASGISETSETTRITRSSTPQFQKRRSALARPRTSLPDRLHKSLPPINNSTSSGENEEENTGQKIIDIPTKTPSRPSTTLKTARKSKSQTNVQNGEGKKSGSITASEVQLFNRTTGNIAESISSLKLGLQDVDKAIKIDNEIIQKHQMSLQQLELKRENLLSKIREKEEWLKKYSNNVQPLQDQIIGLYEKVGQVRATLAPQKKSNV